MSATKARRPIKETAFWQAYNRSRYAILFYALLLTLLVMPIATTIGLATGLLKFLLAARGCWLGAARPKSWAAS